MTQEELSASLTERVLVNDQKIKVLVLDCPEKWETADCFHPTMTLPRGAGADLRIPMQGLSMAQWDAIESAHTTPVWNPEDGEKPPEFVLAEKEADQARQVAVLEAATGKKIPGETLTSKIQFLNQRNPAEHEALRFFIHRELCNFSGYDGPLAALYEQGVKNGEAVNFSSFEDWNTASSIQHFYRMHRFGQEFLVEVPLRSVSAEDNERIQEVTKEPLPPAAPIRDWATGGFVRGKTRPNHNDPAHLAKTRAIAQKRTVMYLNACLPFALPGKDEREQYDWLSHRLVGDVTRLNAFIQQNILGIGRYYSFFSVE